MSQQTRAVLAAYELAGENAEPTYSIPFLVGVSSGDYLEGARRNGEYGFSPEQLTEQPQPIRVIADKALVGLSILRRSPRPSRRRRSAGLPQPLPIR